MNKRRKTRFQKKIADLRRKLVETKPQEEQSNLGNSSQKFSYNFNTSSSLLNSDINKKPLFNYSFVLPDIFKTAITTLAIISFQIFLLLLSKYHIIKLP